MPLDHYAHYNGVPSDENSKFPNAIAELRLSLIGNKDLKNKLVRDRLFLKWFQGQIKVSIDNLTSMELPLVQAVSDLRTKVVILRVLVTFAEQSHVEDIGSMESCVPFLSELVKYVVQQFIPLCSENKVKDGVSEILEAVVCDTFHIIVVFANILKDLSESVSFDCIWKLTVTLLVMAENRRPEQMKMKHVISAGLNVIPFCLDKGPSSTAVYAEGLLAIVLKRLLLECSNIHNFYFLGLRSELVDPLAEDVAPSLVPDKKVLQENFDLSLITALMVSASQLLNYFKDHGSPMATSAVESEFFSSRKVYLCLLLLLRCDDCNLLNVASLNLIRFYLAALLANSDASAERLVYANFEKLFPRIIELLNYDYHSALVAPIPKYLQLPVSILSDLCLKYSGICVHLRNTNVDYKIMRELETLFKQVSIFGQLDALKSNSEKGTKLADFTSLKKQSLEFDKDALYPKQLLQSIQLDEISNYLVLLSVFTSSNEEFRRRITGFLSSKDPKTLRPNFLCLMIFEMMDNFRFLVQQMVLSYKIFGQYTQVQLRADDGKFLSWFGSNIGVIFTLIEHPIYSHTLYLIRSLSRSVSTLRTFFVDCNSIHSVFDVDEMRTENGEDVASKRDNIVEIVASRYNRDTSFKRRGSFVSSLLEVLGQLNYVHQVMQFFGSAKSDFRSHRNQSRKSICIKKVILLASIANFTLDFSSFRYEIVNHESFLRDLSVLYKNAVKAKQDYDASSTGNDELREIAYEQLREQLGVLQVLKNYLYNENEENRKFVWDYIPLTMIFDKSLYGLTMPAEQDKELHNLLLQHKIISFEIMRNLTAASAYFSEIIKESYEEYLRQKSELQIPTEWNDYLLGNLMCYGLFVETDKEDQATNSIFFNDDEFLFKLLKDPDYVRLVVGVNYLEDHRYTNLPTFRKSDFPIPSLLNVWKRFLEVNLLERLEFKLCGLNVNQRVRLSNQLIEVKISIDGIIINLTWKDDDYGYQMPDKVNFRLLDTVLGRNAEGNSSCNLFTSSNIVIEDSDEEDEEDGEPIADPVSLDEDSVLSPEERAKILHKHGFSGILQKLIYKMSTPKYHARGSNKRSPLERFDNLNANDLYEKSKTAHYQILSLVSGVIPDQSQPFRAQQHQKKEERHPLRRSSNIINSREGARIRGEVNRGGEGFGYGSDEDYLHNEEPNEEEEEEVEDDNAEESPNTAEAEEEDIDEFWIR